MASVVVGFPTEAMEFFQWKTDQHETSKNWESLLVMAQNRSKPFVTTSSTIIILWFWIQVIAEKASKIHLNPPASQIM